MDADVDVVLSEPQQEKLVTVLALLAHQRPNEWLSLHELDILLPRGAQITRFPREWLRATHKLQSAFGLQVRLPATANRAEVALRYVSATFHNPAELLKILASPESFATDSRAASRTVGLNTLVTTESAEVEAVLRSVIDANSVLFVVNHAGAAQAKLRSAGTAGAAALADDDDGGGFDGGRAALVEWQKEAPLGIIRSTVTTRRRLKMTTHGTLPDAMYLREEASLVLQRQDDCSADKASYGADASRPRTSPWPPGTAMQVSFRVNDEVATAATGLSFTPTALVFTQDAQRAEVKLSAHRSGVYSVVIDVAMCPPGEPPTAFQAALRLAVRDVFAYDHARVKRMALQERERDGGNAAAGGVVLFRHDPFPLPLPPDLEAASAFQSRLRDAPPWWANPSPLVRAAREVARPSDDTVADTARHVLHGLALMRRLPEGQAGPQSAQAILARGLSAATKAAQEKTRRKKRHFARRELSNRHLLNTGLDMRLPFKQYM